MLNSDSSLVPKPLGGKAQSSTYSPITTPTIFFGLETSDSSLEPTIPTDLSSWEVKLNELVDYMGSQGDRIDQPHVEAIVIKGLYRDDDSQR